MSKELTLVTLQVGTLQTNCYILIKGRESLIVDPGDDADFILQKVTDLGVQPKALIATHGHFDHIMAVNDLKAALDIPFYLPSGDNQLLAWYRKSAKRFGHFDPGPPPAADGSPKEAVVLTRFELSVLETPGHTPGGICLYSKKERLLFSGDTIFAYGQVGRYDFPYCAKDKLVNSVEKLIALPKATVVYPGHGIETTIGEFKDQTNFVSS